PRDVARRRDRALHVEPGARDQTGRPRPPVGGGRGRCGRAAAGDRPVRVRRLVRRPPARHPEARLRADAARRQGRLRPQRPGAPGLGDAAEGLQVHRRPPVGREMKMAKSNRRSFLAKAPAMAVVAAAAAAPALAKDKDKDKTAAAPVKKVLWTDGKRPEKQALFSPAVSYGNLLFISGIGAHFEGDIKAHTAHVLDEIKKKLEASGSSMEKVLKVNVYLNDLKDYAGMNEVF